MRKIFLFLVVLAVAVSAQVSLNFRGYADTSRFTTWCKDSLHVTAPFKLFETTSACVLIFVFDDTIHAARKADSVHAELGYETGNPIINLSGTIDTVWSAKEALDTINTVEGIAKMYNPALCGIEYSRGAIDTTVGTSQSAAWNTFTPMWGPYIRFYAKGLASNLTTKPIKGKLIFEQKAHNYVRQD
jgi:hypothetical protein